MRGRLHAIWVHPVTEKWGRLALMFAVIIPAFLWFNVHPATVRRNQVILLFIMTALAIGLVASIITTVRYPSRSLGLFAIILGSLLYYIYIFLLYVYHQQYEWLANMTRACFLIGSPLFAIATVVNLIQGRKERNVSTSNQ